MLEARRRDRSRTQSVGHHQLTIGLRRTQKDAPLTQNVRQPRRWGGKLCQWWISVSESPRCSQTARRRWMVFDSFKRQSPLIQAPDKNWSRDIARKTRRRSRFRNTEQYFQAGSPEKGVRNAINGQVLYLAICHRCASCG